MADVAPDLTADLLAAFSSLHGILRPVAIKSESAPPHDIADLPPLEDHVEATPKAAGPDAIEPSASPSKRPRTTELEDEGCAEKRQRTEDHGQPENAGSNLSAPSWDVSAMIQNALGSFDHQLGGIDTTYNSAPQTTQPQTPAGTGAATATGAAAPIVTPPTNSTARKVEQRRMKFSSNPYYVMRTMSLPLLGSLVSCCLCP